MRYRIVIELDTEKGDRVNELAQRMFDEAGTSYSTPVFLSTEKIALPAEILRDNI